MTKDKNKHDKENILGNTLKDVRPSYNARKDSWAKKMFNEQLKRS